jgi:hypothetical protein
MKSYLQIVFTLNRLVLLQKQPFNLILICGSFANMNEVGVRQPFETIVYHGISTKVDLITAYKKITGSCSCGAFHQKNCY